jgi:hypothetical protein
MIEIKNVEEDKTCFKILSYNMPGGEGVRENT